MEIIEKEDAKNTPLIPENKAQNGNILHSEAKPSKNAKLAHNHVYDLITGLASHNL